MNALPETETVTFTVKGQVVIPRKFRKEFEIEGGTKAAVTVTPGNQSGSHRNARRYLAEANHARLYS